MDGWMDRRRKVYGWMDHKIAERIYKWINVWIDGWIGG